MSEGPESKQPSALISVTLIVVSVYLAFFGVLILDDRFLDHYLFYSMPELARAALRTIYWPLIELFRLIG